MLPLTTAALALLASWLAAPAGDDWKKAYNDGQMLYNAKKYADAIVQYERVVAAADAPEEAKSGSAYNIGCCYALDAKKDKAVEWVVKSIDMGFLDFDHVKKDEDLTSVIGDARIADAMKRNEAKHAEWQEKNKEIQAKTKAMQAEGERKYEEKLMREELPAALAKLKDKKGAGFAFDFNLTTLDGKPLTKKSLEGKVAIVDIWGTWCGPCKREIPHFIELTKKHAKDPFVIVGLNDEDTKQNKNAETATKKAVDYAKENGITYSLALIDTPTFKQVPNFEGYPTTLFLDKKGNVRLVEVGTRPFAYLDAIVNALLTEGETAKPVPAAGEKKNP